MKLVGASWAFIRRPFLRRNFWIGVLAAFIADSILWDYLKLTDGKSQTPHALRAALAMHAEPVSYTHLDVYKRQLPDR